MRGAPACIPVAPKRNKFGAQKTNIDGIAFDSKGEAHRYALLKLWQASGGIRDLVLQPEYPIYMNGTRVCVCRWDFSYTEVSPERFVIEDFKGVRTPIYRLKKKLFEAAYGLTVTEVLA